MMAGRIVIARHHSLCHRMRPTLIPIALSREPRYLVQKSPFSSSNSSNQNNSSVSDSSKLPSSSTESANAATSKIKQLFNALTSTASESATQATNAATQAATEATEVAAKKAKTVAVKASSNLRHSLTNAKVDAKQKGEQYAWEAHRSMTKMGENMKQSAKVAAKKTGERMKESISGISQSASDRLKKELSQRLPEMPKLPFTKKIPSTSSSAQESSPQKLISDALPSKDQLLKSATTIATETVSKTTSNVTTQVSETVHKATRWLWWWGLAAVGVYGMSTTLTKEGIQMIKEMVTPTSSLLKKEQSTSVEKVSPALDVTADAVRDDDIARSDVVDESANDSSTGRASWLTSWWRR